MTEQHTAAILIELRRIGVELDLASEPLVATGFTQRSLLEWLHQVPSGAGREEFDRRLHEHALDALASSEHTGRPNVDGVRLPDRRDTQDDWRWWPSTMMLDAGIELFAEEWDPVGLRTGSVPPEDIGEYVFHLFGALLRPAHGCDGLTHAAAMIGSIEDRQLGLRPSPELHRRYLAMRLQEIVGRFPRPECGPCPPNCIVVMGETPPNSVPPALDPEGTCSRCHKFGTVARVTVQSRPPRNTRFCAECWRQIRPKYVSSGPQKPPETAHERIAWLDRSAEPPTSAESRSWDDTVESLRLVLTARNDPEHASEVTPAFLAEIASALAAEADKMDGPMPEEVDTFIRAYAPPA
jgi:hypothetical protein